MSVATSSVVLLAGGDSESQIAAAIRELPPDRHVVVASRASTALARQVASALQRQGRSVRLIAPVESLAGAWLRARSTHWVDVDVGSRASRLTRATLPDTLANTSCTVAVNSITPNDAPGDPITIGLWAQFAHPRQRTGARLSDPRDGLTAELALAVQPRLTLLFAIRRDIPLLIATTDPDRRRARRARASPSPERRGLRCGRAMGAPARPACHRARSRRCYARSDRPCRALVGQLRRSVRGRTTCLRCRIFRQDRGRFRRLKLPRQVYLRA